MLDPSPEPRISLARFGLMTSVGRVDKAKSDLSSCLPTILCTSCSPQAQLGSRSVWFRSGRGFDKPAEGDDVACGCEENRLRHLHRVAELDDVELVDELPGFGC